MRPILTDIVGNERLKAHLGSELTEGRLSHAYILAGPRGSGKHTLALRIAAALACEETSGARPLPCMECPSCRKLLSGNSPDVIYIGREDKATLGVDAVRGLRRDVLIPPNDLNVKVYLIEDAHLMTVQAQNAFLLTLEEPPSYVLFLLLAESVAPLLETIKSRAPTLMTQPVPTEDIRAHLIKTDATAAQLARENPSELEELLAAASGSIGRAKDLLTPAKRAPILAERQRVRDWITLCSGKRDTMAAVKLINAGGQKREELVSFFTSARYALRDLLLIKQTEHAPLCFFSNAEEAMGIAYSFTTPELLRLTDLFGRATDRIRAGANIRLSLTELAVGCGLLK